MATTASFIVATHPCTNAVVLHCSGEIDLWNVQLLSEPLREHLAHLHRELAVDLSGVTYLDSAAIKELLRAAIVLDQRGQRLRVRATPHQQKLLVLSGGDALLDMDGAEDPAADGAVCHGRGTKRSTCMLEVR
jgi:anti-anti-sigma factor